MRLRLVSRRLLARHHRLRQRLIGVSTEEIGERSCGPQASPQERASTATQGKVSTCRRHIGDRRDRGDRARWRSIHCSCRSRTRFSTTAPMHERRTGGCACHRLLRPGRQHHGWNVLGLGHVSEPQRTDPWRDRKRTSSAGRRRPPHTVPSKPSGQDSATRAAATSRAAPSAGTARSTGARNRRSASITPAQHGHQPEPRAAARDGEHRPPSAP